MSHAHTTINQNRKNFLAVRRADFSAVGVMKCYDLIQTLGQNNLPKPAAVFTSHRRAAKATAAAILGFLGYNDTPVLLDTDLRHRFFKRYYGFTTGVDVLMHDNKLLKNNFVIAIGHHATFDMITDNPHRITDNSPPLGCAKLISAPKWDDIFEHRFDGTATITNIPRTTPASIPDAPIEQAARYDHDIRWSHTPEKVVPAMVHAIQQYMENAPQDLSA